MKTASISQIGLDSSGLLVVTPVLRPGEGLEFIYRAALSTRWLPDLRALTIVSDSRLSHSEAFQCIVASAKDEYGLKLIITKGTDWSNVPAKVRAEIEAGANHAA